MTSESSAKTMLITGGLFGLLSVVLGAFAAHGLSQVFSPAQLDTWQTGVAYQMYHSLVLLFSGLWLLQGGPAVLRAAGWLFILGIIAFSGSIYGLAFTSAWWLGPVTPLGGLSLISGWLCLCVAGLQSITRGDRA